MTLSSTLITASVVIWTLCTLSNIEDSLKEISQSLKAKREYGLRKYGIDPGATGAVYLVTHPLPNINIRAIVLAQWNVIDQEYTRNSY